MKPLLRRVSAPASPPLRLSWNGQPLQAREGDTVLTAVLLAQQQLRAPWAQARRAPASA